MGVSAAVALAAALAALACAAAHPPARRRGALAVQPEPPRFACLTQSVDRLLASLPAARVNDTVCDCCDGSDEAAGLCPSDGCAALVAAQRSLLVGYAALADKGAAQAAKAMLKADRAKAAFEALHRDFDAAVKHVRALERAVQSEGQRLQALHSARKPIAPSALAAFQRQQEAARAAGVRTLQLQAQASVDWGSNRRLLALLAAGCAASPPLNEKQTKGGSTTSRPKTYAYVVCPFANVTQVEVAPDEWTRAEAASKTGDGDASAVTSAATGGMRVDADGAVVPAAARAAGRLVGDATLLGTFRGYVRLSQLDAHVVGGWTDNPTAWGRQRPAPPELTMELPALVPSLGAAASSSERDLAAVALVFEGADSCRSADMVLPRRAYVFHVCPGHNPAALRAARDAVRLAVAAAASASPGERTEPPAASPSVAGWAGEPASGGHWPPITAGWNGNRSGTAAGTAAAAAGDAAVTAAVLRAAAGSASAPSPLGAVVDVLEDGMCTYFLTVATAMACSKQRARDVRAALSVLNA